MASKAYRWLGAPGGAGGVLHIKHFAADGSVRVVVVPPYTPGEVERQCIIKDPENLAALGEERIAQLVKDGALEPVKWVDGLWDILRAEPPAYDPATGTGSIVKMDVEQGQRIAQESATVSQALRDTACPGLGDTTSSALPRPPLKV